MMKVMEFLHPGAVTAELKADTKRGALEELVQLLKADGAVVNVEEVVKVLLEREAVGSTGIGQGIALPHGKSGQVKGLVGALGVSRKGIPFDALDGEPVYLVFLLLAPVDSAGQHLKALAKVTRLLKDKFFRQSLREAQDAAEIVKLIGEEDEY